MSDDGQVSDDIQITFNIKSSNDVKYVMTVPQSMIVADLKAKLSTSDYADIPVERQRLIYSGRVLKDPDTLATYKIKDGNTVHMVKGAASGQHSNPANQQSGVPAATGVPQNLATGTGNDPLTQLTGARHAGFAQMPQGGMFGPDGGMGAPPNPDELLRQLDNPMFQSQMQEAMQNPQVIQMLENNPMIRNNPGLRQLLRDPSMRSMIMDPAMIRYSMQMQRAMGGAEPTGMPAPGATDQTPLQDSAITGGGTSATPTQTDTIGNTLAVPPNPFAFMGQPGAAGASNPFAALFGGMYPAPTTAAANATNTTGTDLNQQPAFNPFGVPPAGVPGIQNQPQNPMAAMYQQMLQDPNMTRNMMQMMGGLNPAGGAPTGLEAFGAAPTPQDTRPPEEQYAEQLRQLNDMGFYEFTRNVRALRMSGGSVQGAVEALLNGV